jgi:hypothetical protein
LFYSTFQALAVLTHTVVESILSPQSGFQPSYLFVNLCITLALVWGVGLK